ncbi:hypothetical protein R50345_02555 [Paenibacillus sp. FSL R5-0345]|uniref:hypothetical protein n=1 Tax=Paenibacillus sp. FSL R5-0345 TaxID=1536770 RepID=UPI0004F5C624|nr:hypothetical protein [Paenibacillus sp. FSL R5-0345]AIQ33632.1 hypothetical protein R50345_02555 [Paenibacillus sp. FSL R5-0345]
MKPLVIGLVLGAAQWGEQKSGGWHQLKESVEWSMELGRRSERNGVWKKWNWPSGKESGRVGKEKREGKARRIVLKSNLFAYF